MKAKKVAKGKEPKKASMKDDKKESVQPVMKKPGKEKW